MENSALLDARNRLNQLQFRLMMLQGLLGLTLFVSALTGTLSAHPAGLVAVSLAMMAGMVGQHKILDSKSNMWEDEFARRASLERDLIAARDGLEQSRLREQAQYREAARALATIESSSQSLALIDENFQIRLINPCMRKALEARKAAEPHLTGVIDRALAGGDCDNMSGPMDPPLSERLKTLKEPARWEIAFGSRVLRVGATRVEDAQGQFLGYATEWRDHTAELATQREIADIVHRAAAGELDSVLSLDNKHGFHRNVSEGINTLLGNCRRGMESVARALQALAEGRLEQQADNHLQGLFGAMQRNTDDTVTRLVLIVERIHESTELIQAAVQEISRGMTDLSQRTDSQAREIEGTAASMEELTTTVRQNGESARQANQLAREASATAGRGGTVMEQVVESMGSIRDTSRRIGDILGVIDSIAFQTNILAVNASVEAARAGEQGRGFAVVAAEVGKLSQRSSLAAREIRTLMTETEERVRTGATQVATARGTMHDIVDAVGRVETMMAEISDASAQQTLGINFVNEAIAEMDAVTQQNAAMVEEAAVATEALDQQARVLAHAVSSFSVNGRILGGLVRPPSADEDRWQDARSAFNAAVGGNAAVGSNAAVGGNGANGPPAAGERTAGRRTAKEGTPSGLTDLGAQSAKLVNTNSQFTRFQNAPT